MGPPTLCEHCGKKFKVFAKRRKCAHCLALLCRACIAPHVSLRHPNVASSALGGSSSNLTEGSYADDDDDVHFHSPLGATGSGSGSSFGSASSLQKKQSGASSSARNNTESSVDLLDDLDGVDVVDVDENEDDNDDDDDGNDEDLLLGEFSRRASMEEEETQFREFTQLQHAVEKWTRAEIEIKRQQRLAKQSSLVYATKPVRDFGSTRAYQQRELFYVSYAVAVTLAVWAVCVISMVIYGRLLERTLSTA